MLGEYLVRVQQNAPLIHCINNYVTANDVANLLLASGARPIMADDPDEAAEITAISDGLCLNLGTLDSRKIPSMLAAGKAAGRKGIPCVLDPVGAGSSRLRTQTAFSLLREVPFSVIRGNISEIRTLVSGSGHTRGVDADETDQVADGHWEQAVLFAKQAAKHLGAVLVVTGPTDLVTDGTRCFLIRNGCPEMGRITGTGCQLSALTAAFLAANPQSLLEAAAAAVCTMGLAGELAAARMRPEDGNIACRGYLIDAVYNMTGERLEKGANFEIR